MNRALDLKPSLPPLPEEPLVSVLTTSYNHWQWVQDGVNSVTCQSYRYIEQVIVDDGSADGSQQLVGCIIGGRAHVYLRDNRGQARALNHAFELSHGQIIGWFNSDDEEYDLHDATDAYIAQFRPLAAAVFADLPTRTAHFDCYRQIISEERDVFYKQVQEIFGGPAPGQEQGAMRSQPEGDLVTEGSVT